MFKLKETYVMESAVEVFGKEEKEEQYSIVIGMASGGEVRFVWDRKAERDEIFEALVKRMTDYQRCNGIFGPV